MRQRTTRAVRALALVAVGAVLGGTVFAVAAKKPLKPARYAPEPAHSIRDTGVGLPRIGSEGTLGVGEFTQAVRNYHDSGAYANDLSIVATEAQHFMVSQARALRLQHKSKGCRNKSKKVRARACRKNLAIVLDIDETSLSNYAELNAADFMGAQGALVLAFSTADSPAIPPVLAIHKRAEELGIATFFVTGRPPGASALTRQNLAAAGYGEPDGLYMKPVGQETIAYKSNARATIENVLEYRIIANIGDQESDLAGGYADRSFKLPNPFYFIE